MVIDCRRASDRGAALVQRAADPQGACAIDQGVRLVVEGLHAEVHALASGKRCRRTVFRQIVKGDSVNAHRVAIETPGADITQRFGINAGVNAIDQAVVHQRAGGGQGIGAGVDFTAGAIGETGALHVERAARQQFPAVGHSAWCCEGEIAVSDDRAAVVQAVFTAQIHIPEREQLAAAVDSLRMQIQRLTRFRRSPLVDEVQPATGNIQQAG
ncbi:hypothetical protein D3C71_1336040 [compost metagenome]